MGSFNLLKAETSLVIPFHDVDSMGIVWHGHYLKYFEIARCELLGKIGFGYREMWESDYSWPIIDSRVKYVQAITFEQQVTITASLKEYDLRLKMNYLITDTGTNQRLTKGHTIQAAVNRETGEIAMPLPAVFTDKVQEAQETQKAMER